MQQSAAVSQCKTNDDEATREMTYDMGDNKGKHLSVDFKSKWFIYTTKILNK